MSTLSTQYLQLVTQHQAAIYSYIRAMAPGAPVDDILQETNITLWEKGKQFTMGTNFKAFALRIAYLKTLEALRRQKRDEWLVFDSELMERMVARAGNTRNDMFRQNALQECLGNLNEGDQSLIQERYTEGRTIRQIAQTHQRSEGAMQQVFFRIRNALRTCIEYRLAGTKEKA